MNTRIEEARIEEALHEVADTATPPPIDQVAFARRVRAHRTRRRAGIAAVAVAAAVTVLAVPLAANTWFGSEPQQVAAGPGPSDDTLPPVYFIRDDKLMALDPTGEVHTLAPFAERIVGFGEGRVLAIGADSRLVTYVAATPAGDDAWTWTKVASPTTDSIHNVAISANRRWTAWNDGEGNVTVYDNQTSRVDDTFPTGHDAATVAVSEDGLFFVHDDLLHWRHESGDVTTFPDSTGWSPQVAGGQMLLSGTEEEDSKVLALGADPASALTITGGSAALSPSGDQVVTIAPNEGDTGTILRLWTRGGGTVELSGVMGRASEVRWLDQSTVLVGGWQGVHTCSTDTKTCEQLDLPAGDIRIS